MTSVKFYTNSAITRFKYDLNNDICIKKVEDDFVSITCNDNITKNTFFISFTKQHALDLVSSDDLKSFYNILLHYFTHNLVYIYYDYHLNILTMTFHHYAKYISFNLTLNHSIDSNCNSLIIMDARF